LIWERSEVSSKTPSAPCSRVARASSASSAVLTPLMILTFAPCSPRDHVLQRNDLPVGADDQECVNVPAQLHRELLILLLRMTT